MKPAEWPGWLVVARILFFLQCCAASPVNNFLVVYLHHRCDPSVCAALTSTNRRGFGYRAIGIVNGAISPILKLLSQPALNFLADQTGQYVQEQ